MYNHCKVRWNSKNDQCLYITHYYITGNETNKMKLITYEPNIWEGSVPISSILMSFKWPQLRSMAHRHILSKNPELNEIERSLWMSMVRHLRGSLQMFHQWGHTLRPVVTISAISSLWSMFFIKSTGSSSQFGFVISPFGFSAHNAIMWQNDY